MEASGMRPPGHTTDAPRRVAAPTARRELLEGALRSLRGVIEYDLAVLYTLQGGRLVVEATGGPLADSRVRGHSLALERFGAVRRALETRRPISLEAHDHDTEGDPYDGVLDLPRGHSCMIIPLFAGGRDLGIITLDRKVCEVYSERAVAIAGMFGQVVSIAMAFAAEATDLQRDRDKLEAHNRLLRDEIGGDDEATARIDASRNAGMRDLAEQARQVAPAGLPVLLQGESGTGKELLAQAIHAWSGRTGAFVRLNCAAIPDSLVESELFGHIEGACSGAVQDRPGRFVTADGGTLLLDEIAALPLPAQAKLLRVLQEGALEPVGSDRTVSVDVRVIAASHRDLQAAVAEGRFREDLYSRLAVFPLQVPALRERVEDIGPIARAVLDSLARKHGRGPWTLTPAAVATLEAEPWPGNVRQLVNVLERATILRPVGEIDAEHLGLGRPAGSGRTGTPDDVARPAQLLTFRDAVRRHLMAALVATKGKIYGPEGAAALLDVKPTTLQSKLKRHGIDRARSVDM
jgi:transcriptional regulator with GAF, ATPase, and Fis domain